jgi:NAD(P)-dependent dehydrogenase (short-subunit alcohol dehydrogenase family)
LLIGRATTLGNSLAAALSEKGIDIALVYTGAGEAADESAISQTRQQVEEHGRRCLIFWGQPADHAFAHDVIEKILTTFGRLDIVISYSVPLSTLSPMAGGTTGQQGVVPNLPLLRLALGQIIST